MFREQIFTPMRDRTGACSMCCKNIPLGVESHLMFFITQRRVARPSSDIIQRKEAQMNGMQLN